MPGAALYCSRPLELSQPPSPHRDPTHSDHNKNNSDKNNQQALLLPTVDEEVSASARIERRGLFVE